MPKEEGFVRQNISFKNPPVLPHHPSFTKEDRKKTALPLYYKRL